MIQTIRKNEKKISTILALIILLIIVVMSINTLMIKILYKELKKGKTYKSVINRDVSTINREVLLGNIKKLDMLKQLENELLK